MILSFVAFVLSVWFMAVWAVAIFMAIADILWGEPAKPWWMAVVGVTTALWVYVWWLGHPWGAAL